MFLARMNMAGLRPDHDVLDIGCGVGRVARYLCAYLYPSVRYEGFDVMDAAIAWCQENITPAHPNFGFTATPVLNTAYRTDPSLPDAATFRFPYDDASFDFVCAQSVFTHLLPESAENYVREMARVLRPGGISCTTWLWFNDSGYSHPFTEPMERHDTYAVLNPEIPEAAIAYQEDAMRKMFGTGGLVIDGEYPGYERIQDLCVAHKP